MLTVAISMFVGLIVFLLVRAIEIDQEREREEGER